MVKNGILCEKVHTLSVNLEKAKARNDKMVEKTGDELNELREDRTKSNSDHDNKVEKLKMEHKLEMHRTISACIKDVVTGGHKAPGSDTRQYMCFIGRRRHCEIERYA